MLESSGNFYIILFIIPFVAIVGISIIFIVVHWIKNKRPPRIVVHSAISNKRIQMDNVYRLRNAAPGMRTHKLITYYVTFDLETGEQIELRVSKLKYSELRKGCKGKLTFQGTRYIGFEKI